MSKRRKHSSSQLSINYGFLRPSGKVPISAEKIAEAKKLFYSGDQHGAAEKMREVRESLERYERRIKHKEQ